MLGSSSSHNHCHQEEEEERNEDLHVLDLPPPPFNSSNTPTSIHMRQLLYTTAQLISRSDLTAANRLMNILSANSSPYGDSSDRLVHSFTKALSLRLQRHPPAAAQLSSISLLNNTNTNNFIIITTTTTDHHPQPSFDININDDDAAAGRDEILLESYLSVNQITPFIRFSHLTANQAILEAAALQHLTTHQHQNNNIHILDLDIMHGLQWPPLMQAIATTTTTYNNHLAGVNLRITATGTNLNILRRTGDRLSKFAHSLGLRFRFNPLLLPAQSSNSSNVDILIQHLSAVILLPNETLAVNCVFYLHRLLNNQDKLCLLLKKIKSMNPKIVTLAEHEANHNHPIFLSRFLEAVNYYTAVFESLEATVPPNSWKRIDIEQLWFGREIADIVAEEGDNRRERHERFRSWEVMMRSAGFRNISLSPYALSQAKLLLRLHYPSQGYKILDDNSSTFFLGWQNQPLFNVSSWL